MKSCVFKAVKANKRPVIWNHQPMRGQAGPSLALSTGLVTVSGSPGPRPLEPVTRYQSRYRSRSQHRNMPEHWDQWSQRWSEDDTNRLGRHGDLLSNLEHWRKSPVSDAKAISTEINVHGLKINPTYSQPSVECGRGEVKLRPVRSMSAQSRVTSSLCRLEIPHWYRSNRWVRSPDHTSQPHASGQSPPHPRPRVGGGRGGAESQAGGGGAGHSQRLGRGLSQGPWHPWGLTQRAPAETAAQSEVTEVTGGAPMTRPRQLSAQASWPQATTAVRTAAWPETRRTAATCPQWGPPTLTSPTDSPTWDGGALRDSNCLARVALPRSRGWLPACLTRWVLDHTQYTMRCQ